MGAPQKKGGRRQSPRNQLRQSPQTYVRMTAAGGGAWVKMANKERRGPAFKPKTGKGLSNH